KSKGTRPPPPQEPISRLPLSSAITVTLSRVSGRTSPTVQPEAVASSTTTSSVDRLAMTCLTRESAARGGRLFEVAERDLVGVGVAGARVGLGPDARPLADVT